MASISVSKAVLYVANLVYALSGITLATFGVWFFIQLKELMAFIDLNRYYMNYHIYWVQVIPWILIITGIVLLFVACCGWCSAGTKNKGLLLLYVVFLAVTILAQIVLAVLVFVCVDGANTDDFIMEILVNAFHNANLDTSHEAKARNAFGDIERKYYCCGARSPSDYRNARQDFPLSCCDEDPDLKVCEANNNQAYSRQGCAVVTSLYAKIALKYIAIGAIFIGIAELVGLIVAFARYTKLKKRRIPREENGIMSESKKVLL